MGLDDTSFAKGFEGAKKQVAYFTKEMQANMRIADMAGDKLGVFAAKHEGLTKVISAEEKRLQALTKAYESSKDENGKLTNQSIRYANEIERSRGNLARYNKQLAINSGETAKWKIENEGLTGTLNQAGQAMTSFGKKGEQVGKALTLGVTTPIVAGVGLVTTAAMSWESAFAGVVKTNDEVVDSTGKVVYSYKDLEDGLRGLAKELPATHEEIAAVGEAAGQLGIKTENVVSFTKTMIDLGESTNMSAEVAATSLARLANITQMPQTEFDRLGSSITELGNNFATTESEIVEMALRLAGAGKQVGMSEADIMGLAAALSSVGIEAEMGGSAISKTLINMQVASQLGYDKVKELEEKAGMSRRELELMASNSSKAFKALGDELGMTTTEMNKIIKAGKNLEGFSAIAGMTAQEFKKAYGEDAVGALGKFIEGLATAEEKGTTSIELLDEMGISEVRLRDSLIRAGNASELFASAIDSSNKAWDENTALAEEANKRYATFESQLGMAKNEVKDIAIELGGPFVQAFRDALKAGRPIIEMVANMAKSFSDADPKTQQMIMKLIAYTAAAGPVIGATSKIAKGIGTMTSGTIEFVGTLAKKKKVADFTKEMLGGAKSIEGWRLATQGATASAKTLGPELVTSATTLGKFGSAAAETTVVAGETAGLFGTLTSSVWGFSGVLGAVTSPIGLVTIALGTGYGAWKLWGEEVWNSSQRTKQWGTDVGGVTHEVLTQIKDDTTSATGQFDLLASGLEVNTTSMAANFEKVGQSIENSLMKRIEGLDKMLQELPENFDEKTKKILENEKVKNEEALKIVQENTAKISEIKENAAKNDRALSINEAQIIKDLARDTTEAYVTTLDVSAKEKQKILKAMTGDVEKASKEEAKLWLQSLGEQRKAAQEHALKSKADQEKYLKDMGYNLQGEFAQKYLQAWDEVNKTTIDGFDQQMAVIVQKYPELINQVSMGTGRLITETSRSGEALIQQNQRILKDAEDMANELSRKATRNAEAMKWQWKDFGKSAKEAAMTWNNIILDEKTGEVKTNVKEAVTEATKDVTVWNNIRLVLHEANIDSNAKKVIGEAAIANGYWKGMAWEDKEAVLKDKFSITMYKALDKAGEWDKLTLEAKTAFLYSNTPEVMAETMLKLGLWEEFEPTIKELKANNFEFLQTLAQSEEKLAAWNNTPDNVKKIMGDNYDLLQKIFSSEEMYNRWIDMPNNVKYMLGDNQDLLLKLLGSEEAWNRWQNLPEPEKKILGNNQDLLLKILNSEEEYNRWLNLPEVDKRIIADNKDLLAKIFSSKAEYDMWLALPEREKRLLADNYVAVTKTQEAQQLLDNWLGTPTPGKFLQADSNAPSIAQSVWDLRNQWDQIPAYSSKTFTIYQELVANAQPGYYGPGFNGRGRAKGTNFLNQSGPIVVNDQAGPLYKEIVHQPGDIPRIYEGRNVLIPNAKRGTKVYKAVDTKRIMLQAGIPRFAEGTGVSPDAKIVNTMREINDRAQSVNVVVNQNNSELVQAINELKAILTTEKTTEPLNLNLKLGSNDFKFFVDDISKIQGKEVEIQSNF